MQTKLITNIKLVYYIYFLLYIFKNNLIIDIHNYAYDLYIYIYKWWDCRDKYQ